LNVSDTASPTTTIEDEKPAPEEYNFRTPLNVPEGIEDRDVTKSIISLQILGTGQKLSLESGEEFTLGRISGKQPILPDVDLTPYRAYEDGVSRLHATIKITPEQVSITDLGSANGTRVNNQSIIAHNPHPLKNGDIISLGKFKAQIIIRE
jgi:pSer/pThr/pTyr-binding forkhead associated (FHA) protein